MNRKFDVNSWRRAATAFQAASGQVGGISPPAAAGGGPTKTDATLTELSTRLIQGFSSARGGLVGGLQGDAAGMTTTADSYAGQEAANARTGAKLAGEK